MAIHRTSSHTRAVHIALPDYTRVFVAYTLLSFVAILIVAYVYFVNGSVLSAVERKHTEETSARTAARVATLEAEYFALSESVTLDEAFAKGFVVPPADRTIFASRSVDTDTRLSMR
jgi:hypothetical protein